MSQTWSHVDLMQDLAAWLQIPCGGTTVPRFVTMHASLGSAWGEGGVPQADVLSVRGSHVNFELAIYEVKATRSDWDAEMRTQKWRKYLPFCNRLVFACPAGLIAKADVPAVCGLITRNETGWHGVLAGERRPLEHWDVHTMIGILVSQGNTGRRWWTRPEHRDRRARGLAQAVRWDESRQLRRKLGAEIGRLVRLGRALETGENLVARIETIESNLRGLAKSLGLKPSQVLGSKLLPQWSEWDIGPRLQELQAMRPGIEEAAGLLATQGCPPPPFEKRSCAICERDGFVLRPHCWQEYLLRDRGALDYHQRWAEQEGREAAPCGHHDAEWCLTVTGNGYWRWGPEGRWCREPGTPCPECGEPLPPGPEEVDE